MAALSHQLPLLVRDGDDAGRVWLVPDHDEARALAAERREQGHKTFTVQLEVRWPDEAGLRRIAEAIGDE